MRKLNQSLIVLPKRWKSQTGDSRSNAVLFKLIPRYCQDGEHTLHPDTLRGIVPHCEAPMREMRRSDRGSEPHVRSFPSEHASFYIIHASSGEKVQRGKKGGGQQKRKTEVRRPIPTQGTIGTCRTQPRRIWISAYRYL